MSLLWTVMPPEAIFAANAPRRPALWRYMGRSIYVAEDDKGGGTIVELLSTDPADYLDPAFAPGRTVFRSLEKAGD